MFLKGNKTESTERQKELLCADVQKEQKKKRKNMRQKCADSLY